jgi:hypothetical protein
MEEALAEHLPDVLEMVAHSQQKQQETEQNCRG